MWTALIISSQCNVLLGNLEFQHLWKLPAPNTTADQVHPLMVPAFPHCSGGPCTLMHCNKGSDLAPEFPTSLSDRAYVVCARTSPIHDSPPNPQDPRDSVAASWCQTPRETLCRCLDGSELPWGHSGDLCNIRQAGLMLWLISVDWCVLQFTVFSVGWSPFQTFMVSVLMWWQIYILTSCLIKRLSFFTLR